MFVWWNSVKNRNEHKLNVKIWNHDLAVNLILWKTNKENSDQCFKRSEIKVQKILKDQFIDSWGTAKTMCWKLSLASNKYVSICIQCICSIIYGLNSVESTLKSLRMIFIYLFAE